MPNDIQQRRSTASNRENNVNRFLYSAIALTFAATCTAAGPAPSGHEIKTGDKLQTLANLHPDMQRHELYTLNYQLPGLIPVCSEVTVTKIASKKLSFTYQGQEFELAYDSFTHKANVSFQQAAQFYLGPACDHAKMKSLGAADQEGIRVGHPSVGMTREGVLFAMGRPPIHANADLSAPEWTYWKNRYVRMIVSFDGSGKVSGIQ
jgi:hypothetical protein